MIPKTSGIYRILNAVSGKIYVGSAVNLSRRWATHTSQLRQGKHHSRHLQASWDRHGASAFIFQVIRECPREELIFREQDYLDALAPQYNMAPTAGSTLGVVCSPEKRGNISAAKKGKAVLSKRKMVEFRGAQVALVDLAETTGTAYGCLYYRIHSVGLTPDQAVDCGDRDPRQVYPEVQARWMERHGEAMKKRVLPPKTAEQKEHQRQAVVRYNQTRVLSAETRERMGAAKRKKPRQELAA